MRGSLANALIVGVMLAVALVGANNVRADGVPQFLNVQGVLYDNDGNPVNDNYDLTVSLYRSAAGGAPNLVFQQTLADTMVENGIFHVTLSIPTAGGNPFVLYPALWLGIAVDTDDEMTPRQALTSVGYAMQAKHADEASKARDVFCDGDGDPATDDPVPCVGRGELVQTYALGDNEQEALSAVSLSTKCVGCVGSQHISNGTIATVDLGNGVVTTEKIANGTILSEDIADGQVLSVDLANDSILSEDLKDGEVKTADILNGTIITEDLANLAVSNAKLGADAVTSDKIQNGQVMTVDLADDAVTNAKLADGAVKNHNIGEIIHQDNLPVAGTLADQRGTVIVGDYLAVDPSGVVQVDLNALNFDIDAGLPVGQNLVQWEDVKWKNKADKSGNWAVDTCTSGPGSCLVVTTTDEPRHGGYAIRFAGNGVWLYQRDMIEVAPDREYFGRIRARNASSSTATNFLSGVRCFDKAGVSLGELWFMASEDGDPQLHSLGKTFSGIVAADGLPLDTRYVQPVVGMTGSNGQIDVDALEIFELTTANDVVCAGCVQSADVADGTLATDDLANGAVTSAKIADGTIASSDIGAGEIKTVNIANSAVQTAALADGAVNSAKIADGSVASVDILDGGVTSNDLALGAVTSIKIGDGEVKTDDLANGEVTSLKIQNGTIGTVDLADDAVTAAILATDAVDTAALQNGAVTSAKIANDAVGAAQIATGQVTTDEILNGTIKAEDLSTELAWISGGDVTVPNNKNLIFADDATSNDGAWLTEATTGPDDIEIRMVLGYEEDSTERFTIYRYSDVAGTVKTKEHEFDAAGNAYHKGNLTVGGDIDVGDGNITTTGVISGVLQCPAGECIGTAEIENGTISNEDIAVAAGIAATKIAGEALTKATMHDGPTAQVSGLWNALTVKGNSITTAQIQNAQITNAKMAANAIGSTEIQDGSILGSDLATDTITNTKIGTGAVTSDEILDATIQSVDLANDSVDSAQIKAGAVGSSEILDGGVTSADIGSNQILPNHISPTAYGASGVSTLIARSDHQHDTDYVNANGDTMTGDLTVAHAGDTKITVRSTNGAKAILALESSGVDTDVSLQVTALDTLALKGANLVLDTGKSVTAQNLTLAGSVACTNCVDTTDILDGTITSADISAAGLAKTKIQGTALAQNDTFGGDVSGAWNNLQLGAGVVGAPELAVNSVYTNALQDNAVTTGKIANGTILGADLATDTITATQIANGAIGAPELAANSVYSNAIQNAAVSASKLANGSVSGGQDTAGANAIVDNSITTYDIQDGTIQAGDLTANFWDNLNTNFVVKDGRQLLFEDVDDADRQAYFQEFSGAGALDLGLVLGNNNSDLPDQTFSVYSTDGSTRVLRHQFKADGTAQFTSDTTVGDTAVDLSAGERSRIATYSTPRGDLVVTGAIIHPKDSVAGNGTVLSVADVFEIRGDAYTSSVGHSFLGADATNLVLSAGDRGAGVLTLNRMDGASAGNVVTGGNLVVGGVLQCASGACVVGTNVIANGSITTDDVLDNTLTAADIAANAVGASELANNAVDTAAIAANAVLTGKIADGTILAADLAADTLGAGQIGPSAIGSSELADNSVYTNAIQNDAVTTAKIADGQINSAKIYDDSVTTADIKNYTILAEDIANATLTLDKFTVADRPYAPGKSLTLYKLANESGESVYFNTTTAVTDPVAPYLREVSNDASANDTDLRVVIPDADSNGAEALTIGVNNTIDTWKHKFTTLGDAYHSRNLTVTGITTVGGVLNANGNTVDMNSKTAVSASGTALYVGGDAAAADFSSITLKASTTLTAGTLTVPNTTGFACTDCINATAIGASQVGTSEVADNSLTASDINSNAITGDELAPLAVANGHLVDSAVNSAKIQDNTVTSADLLDGTIVDADVNASANIARTKIAGGAVTGSATWGGHVTGSYNSGTNAVTLNVASGVIGSDQIANGTVASIDLADNSITSSDILDGTITTADLAFSIPTPGGTYTIDRGNRLVFGTGGDNDSAYFQETSAGAVDNSVEVSLNFTDDGDTTERFVIKSNGTDKHWMWANGDAKHQGNLTVVGTSSATEMSAGVYRDATSGSTFYVDPNSVSVVNDMRASIYYDRNNTGYYVDPASTSNVNVIRASSFVDRNNTGYYVDPASTSVTNDMRAVIFRDQNDPTNYYVDPASNSVLNTATFNGAVTFADAYTNGWWRNNNANTGLYNQATGRHFYSADANYWDMAAGRGLRIRDTHLGTVRGYLYTDGGASFGLLDYNGSWKVRVDASNTELYGGVYTSTSYQSFIYDRDDNGYYVDPNSTSRLYYGRFNYIRTGEWGNYNEFHSWTHLNGYYGLYADVNGAHIYPNNGSYGSWRIVGSRNSWYGLEFDTAAGQTSLMVGTTGQGWGSQTIGFHNNSYGWLWRFEHSRLYANGLTDVDNGAYYLDPNSQSVLYNVNMNQVNSLCVARGGTNISNGCPDDWNGVGDSCISTNGDSPFARSTNWGLAVTKCRNNGSHLCSVAELVAARFQASNQWCDWAWASDYIGGETYSIVYMCLSGNGMANISTAHFNAANYGTYCCRHK